MVHMKSFQDMLYVIGTVWYSKVHCTVLFNGIVRYSALENGILRNDGLERFSEEIKVQWGESTVQWGNVRFSGGKVPSSRVMYGS